MESGSTGTGYLGLGDVALSTGRTRIRPGVPVTLCDGVPADDHDFAREVVRHRARMHHSVFKTSELRRSGGDIHSGASRDTAALRYLTCSMNARSFGKT